MVRIRTQQALEAVRRPFLRVKPGMIVFRVQDHGHSIMNWFYNLIGTGSEDRGGL
jgi:hypothetical protein